MVAEKIVQRFDVVKVPRLVNVSSFSVCLESQIWPSYRKGPVISPGLIQLRNWFGGL